MAGQRTVNQLTEPVTVLWTAIHCAALHAIYLTSTPSSTALKHWQLSACSYPNEQWSARVDPNTISISTVNIIIIVLIILGLDPWADQR